MCVVFRLYVAFSQLNGAIYEYIRSSSFERIGYFVFIQIRYYRDKTGRNKANNYRNSYQMSYLLRYKQMQTDTSENIAPFICRNECFRLSLLVQQQFEQFSHSL